MVSDAGQFFEVVQASDAIQAAHELLQDVTQQTGKNSVTVRRRKGESCFLGGNQFSVEGSQICFTFSELWLLFVATMKIKGCSIGDSVVSMKSTPIGGLYSKVIE